MYSSNADEYIERLWRKHQHQFCDRIQREDRTTGRSADFSDVRVRIIRSGTQSTVKEKHEIIREKSEHRVHKEQSEKSDRKQYNSKKRIIKEHKQSEQSAREK